MYLPNQPEDQDKRNANDYDLADQLSKIQVVLENFEVLWGK
jgi:hypothetical protein